MRVMLKVYQQGVILQVYQELPRAGEGTAGAAVFQRCGPGRSSTGGQERTGVCHANRLVQDW